MRAVRSQWAAFSLAEVIIATTIAAFAMVGVLSCFIALQRSHVAAQDSMVETNRFLHVQDLLALDLRNAVAVTSTSPTAFTVRVRYYNDAPADDRTVTYAFDRGLGELTRELNGTERVLMTGLTDLSFSYYRRAPNGTRQETAAAAEVNAVLVTLTPSNHRAGGAAESESVYTSSLYHLRRVVFP